MEKPNRQRSSLTIVLAIVAGIAGGGAAGGLVAYWSFHTLVPPPASGTVNASLFSGTTNPPQASASVINAIRQVAPAVVTITNESAPRSDMAGYTTTALTSGSGLIFDPSGLIVTNNHVIQRAQLLQVYFSDGTKAEGTVISADSILDIAVVKVNGPLPAAVPLGDSGKLELGQTVIAIGSPLNEFRGTTTVGVVSGLNRSVGGMRGLIQTDALINSGDSGGPLLDDSGQVIGINTLVIRTTADGKILEGLGFAIPANQVREVVDRALSEAPVAPPYVGIGYQEVEPQVAGAMKLATPPGVVVTTVEAGSPAAQAGLAVGDVILQVGKQAIDKDHFLTDMLSSRKPGDVVTIMVLRGGKQVQVELHLSRRPSP